MRSSSPKTAPKSSGATARSTTMLEIAVSPEDDAEVRRVSITNHGTPRAGNRADLLCRNRCWRRRPTTWRIRLSPSCSWKRSSSPSLGAILATRRRRSAGDPQVWAAHLAVVEGETSAMCSSKPIGRAFWGAGKRIERQPQCTTAGRFPTRRARARSDLQPAPPRADPARRHRAHRVLDDGGAIARGGARSRRQAS